MASLTYQSNESAVRSETLKTPMKDTRWPYMSGTTRKDRISMEGYSHLYIITGITAVTLDFLPLSIIIVLLIISIQIPLSCERNNAKIRVVFLSLSYRLILE